MKMLIDGQFCDASDGAVVPVLNAATQEYMDSVPQAARADIRRAIRTARDGKRIWAETPVHERSRILYRCADAIDGHREELAGNLSAETGRMIRESRHEIRCCAEYFRAFGEAAAHHYGRTVPDYHSGTEKDILFVKRDPLGIVACLAPFNDPVCLAIQKTAAALAAGNAVIAVPALDAPLTLLSMAAICFEQGIPGSVLQALTGRDSMVGNALSDSEDVSAMCLAGTTAAGQHIASRGLKTSKRVFVEHGSNDPFIVLEDADLNKAVHAALGLRLHSSGQTFCSPKRFLVHTSVHDAFVEGLKEAAGQMKRGNPLDEDADFGCLVSEEAAQEVERQVLHTMEQGASLVLGGHAYNGTWFEPTILDDVTPGMDVAKDMKIFGPVFPVISFGSDEEAVCIANQASVSVQAGLMGGSLERALQVAAGLHAGSVVVNEPGSSRNPEQAFSGWKMSGAGRENITAVLDEMSREKTYILKNVL